MARSSKALITEDEVFERPINTRYISRMLKYLKPYKWPVTGAFITMILSSAAAVSSPLILKYAIDNYIEMNDFSGIPWLALAIVLTSGLSALGMRYKLRLMNITGRKAIAQIRKELFEHIQELGFDFFDTRSAGKIMVRVINDVNSLLGLFNNGIINSLTNIFMVILIAILMLVLDWRLALIGFSTMPFLLLSAFVLRPFIRRTWRQVRQKISNMNGHLHESLAGIKVTYAFAREDRSTDMFRQTNNDINKSWMRAIRINNLMFPSVEIISVLGTCLIYFFGVQRMYPADGTAALSLGTLISMTWYLGQFWGPIDQLSRIYTQLLVAMASLERIFEIMDRPVLIKNNERQVKADKLMGRVEFRDVTFGYDEDQVVLDHVSFSALPGQAIAFAGPTGAGKSTIINLLSRFHDVNSGSIQIDGVDVRDYDLHSLRSNIGIMLQDTFIFSGTIMDNIRYGRLSATDEEVIEAAKAVHAHEFIIRMENGYQTEVNERGSRLSMGQRQLLAFARTLLADPSILILDEATASIDTHTEILIQRAIETLLKGRTSFIIAHRLSTIRKADSIMIVDGGKIIESGTHAELIAMGGVYKALCDSQYRYLEK